MITSLRQGRFLIGGFALALVYFSCGEDTSAPPVDTDDLTGIAYEPVDYELVVPSNYPPLEIPEDNPMTVEGVNLGRFLFYDPLLSRDNSMSCASCHLPEGNFSDNLAKSPGVDGVNGRRSAMVLMDMAFAMNGLFWDGRVTTLEEQALLPVEDPVELHTTWEEVLEKIIEHPDYPARFRRAFGIENKSQITRDLAAKAIAQFERTLVISGNSKYDRVIRGEDVFTDEELAGFEMFFDLNPLLPDAECGHCHNAPLFTTHEYLNNGITNAPDLRDFPDRGFGMVSGLDIDNGKFRVPTLRNIEFSAP